MTVFFWQWTSFKHEKGHRKQLITAWITRSAEGRKKRAQCRERREFQGGDSLLIFPASSAVPSYHVCLFSHVQSLPSFFFFINTVNPFLNRSFPLRCTFCPYSFLFLLPFLFLSLLLSVSGSHWPIPHYTSTPFHFSTVPFNSLDHLNPQHLSLPPSEHYQVTPVELY